MHIPRAHSLCHRHARHTRWLIKSLFQLEPEDVGVWVDYWFLLVFGGIPWQCYYQRVLSAKTSNRAIFLSFGGAAIALIMTGP